MTNPTRATKLRSLMSGVTAALGGSSRTADPEARIARLIGLIEAGERKTKNRTIRFSAGQIAGMVGQLVKLGAAVRVPAKVQGLAPWGLAREPLAALAAELEIGLGALLEALDPSAPAVALEPEVRAPLAAVPDPGTPSAPTLLDRVRKTGESPARPRRAAR